MKWSLGEDSQELLGCDTSVAELLRGRDFWEGGNAVPASATLALGVFCALFSAADPQLGSIVPFNNSAMIHFMPNIRERSLETSELMEGSIEHVLSKDSP